MLYRILCLLTLTLFLGGCKTVSPVDLDGITLNNTASQTLTDATLSQSESIKNLQKIHTQIDANGLAIDTESTKIQNGSTDPEIQKSATEIHNRASEIRQDSAKSLAEISSISKDNKKIIDSSKKVIGLENKLKNLIDERDLAQKDAIKSFYSTLGFFAICGFATIVVGFVLAAFVNKKLGLMIAGIGLMGMACAAGTIYYFKTIALISIAIIIVSILFCVYLAIKYLIASTKETKVYKAATVENVSLLEKVKDYLDDDDKHEIFGAPTAPTPLAQEIQSPTTITVVKKIREELLTTGMSGNGPTGASAAAI